MPTNKKMLKTYVTAEEKDEIEAMAAQINITVSKFLQRVATGTRLPTPGNAKQITDLLSVNADLARLGNLFKMALDDADGYIDTINGRKTVESLIEDIRDTQNTLKAKVMEL